MMGDQISTHYLVGLIVGEGSFVTDMTKDSSLTIGMRMRPACRVGMNDVDADMLEKVKEQVGFGQINSRGNDMTTLSFRNQEEIKKLIELIDSAAEENPALRESHKFECYKRWKKVAKALVAGEHTQDHKRAKELITDAHNVNKKFGGWGKDIEDWWKIVEESKDT